MLSSLIKPSSCLNREQVENVNARAHPTCDARQVPVGHATGQPRLPAPDTVTLRGLAS